MELKRNDYLASSRQLRGASDAIFSVQDAYINTKTLSCALPPITHRKSKVQRVPQDHVCARGPCPCAPALLCPSPCHQGCLGDRPRHAPWDAAEFGAWVPSRTESSPPGKESPTAIREPLGSTTSAGRWTLLSPGIPAGCNLHLWVLGHTPEAVPRPPRARHSQLKHLDTLEKDVLSQINIKTKMCWIQC